MSEDDMKLRGRAGPDGSGDRTAALARAIASLAPPARKPSLRDELAPVLPEIEAALAWGALLKQIWATAADQGVNASFDRFRKVLRQLRSASPGLPDAGPKAGRPDRPRRKAPRARLKTMQPSGDRTPPAEEPCEDAKGSGLADPPAAKGRRDSWQLFDD